MLGCNACILWVIGNRRPPPSVCQRNRRLAKTIVHRAHNIPHQIRFGSLHQHGVSIFYLHDALTGILAVPRLLYHAFERILHVEFGLHARFLKPLQLRVVLEGRVGTHLWKQTIVAHVLAHVGFWAIKFFNLALHGKVCIDASHQLGVSSRLFLEHATQDGGVVVENAHGAKGSRLGSKRVEHVDHVRIRRGCINGHQCGFLGNVLDGLLDAIVAPSFSGCIGRFGPS